MYEPSAKVRVLSTVLIIRDMWTNQISKKPSLMRISWSSCDKSIKPGTRLANSTTLCIEGVTRTAKCCHITIFCCSRESAAEPVFEVGESSLVEPVWYSSRLWRPFAEADALIRCQPKTYHIDRSHKDCGLSDQSSGLFLGVGTVGVMCLRYGQNDVIHGQLLVLGVARGLVCFWLRNSRLVCPLARPLRDPTVSNS